MKPPAAGALENGGFAMSWDHGRHHFEIEVTPDGTFDWFYMDRGSETRAGEEDQPLDAVSPGLISQLRRTLEASLAKIFISHRGSDLPIAERLAAELRDAGHSVWLDTWSLGPGDSVVGGMNQGLMDATHVVVLYSTAGIDSPPWMAQEWMSTLARQLEGLGVKILPVLLAGGRPPAILADLKYVDLAKSWDAGMNALLRALP